MIPADNQVLGEKSSLYDNYSFYKSLSENAIANSMHFSTSDLLTISLEYEINKPP